MKTLTIPFILITVLIATLLTYGCQQVSKKKNNDIDYNAQVFRVGGMKYVLINPINAGVALGIINVTKDSLEVAKLKADLVPLFSPWIQIDSVPSQSRINIYQDEIYTPKIYNSETDEELKLRVPLDTALRYTFN